MAIGTKTDFKIYNEEFWGGYVEVLQQNANGFNEASNGAIRLVPQRVKGDYEKESFLQEIADLVSRRDTTSMATRTDKALAHGEKVSIKLNRAIGPVAHTLDAFRKISQDPQEMSFLLGQQIGKAVAVDQVNNAVAALKAALGGQAAVSASFTGAGETLTHNRLVTGLSKFGDAAERIQCWVMHSKQYFDLVGNAITEKVYEVAGAVIMSGNVATLNRPTLVLDAPGLVGVDAGGAGVNHYYTLGLVPNAAVVKESEERELVSDLVTGHENLAMRIQGEYAYNLGLQGFAWDVTNGGINPTNAAIATATNWDMVVTDAKSLAGVHVSTR